jgi:hypothetical protein
MIFIVGIYMYLKFGFDTMYCEDIIIKDAEGKLHVIKQQEPN